MKILTLAALSLAAAGWTFLSSLSNANGIAAAKSDLSQTAAPVVTFRLDPSQSTFIVHANRAGIAWFEGHSHRIAAKDFSGEASLSLDAVNPASLTMNIRSASLEETDPFFTDAQKKTINGEINNLVLETAKYPEITFKSTSVKGALRNGAFNVEIMGNIMMHGVTRPVTIPATVTVDGDTMRAKGKFRLDRKKFGVNATAAFHGLVKVRHTLIFEFDIIGKKI
jgi:polyisoprenoid-binding protein YceI